MAETARANFILARAAILTGHPEEAIDDFQKTLATSKEPRLLAWSHIYLGRMLDLDCKRDEALAEYKEALATRDGAQDTRLAAERGVKTAYAVSGHSCEDDTADDAPDPAPAKPAGPVPAGAAEAAITAVRVQLGMEWRLIAVGRVLRLEPPLRANSQDSVGRFKRVEAHVEAALAELEEALGHGFAKPELLVRALTHRSLANQQTLEDERDGAPSAGNNERLEFLGDAVLGLVVAEALFLLHPDWQEGELTRVRAQLVSRQHMAKVAEAIGLGNHLRLSRGEDRSGLRRKSTVLSNTMEAVIGALFLDGGLEPVRAFARRYVMGETAEHLARELRSGAALGNYKSALQEHLQAARAGTPLYKVKSESGPDHRKRFLVEVRLKPAEGEPGKPLARGMGSTKKTRRAGRRAARAGPADCDCQKRAAQAGEEEEEQATQ